MKKRTLSILILLCQVPLLFSQDIREEVLMTIHDRQITPGEFKWYYQKDNSLSPGEKLSVQDYLEYFIPFKLKVIEAEELGYDTSLNFRNELSGFSEQLAQPYLTRKKGMEDLLKEAYKRAQTDLDVSFINLPCAENASPEDTTLAFEAIMAARHRVLKGEHFDSVGVSLEDDTTTTAFWGSMGYITVFDTKYLLENIAYSTPPGEVSQPVRTQFGYFILKVNKSRPSPGYLKVAHIMAYAPDSSSEEQHWMADRRIRAVHDSIFAGYPFEELAQRNSDDKRSLETEGELPWFKTGQTIPEFHEMALTLNSPGEISRPFQTTMGWHVIKLIDKKGLGSYEAMKAELTDQIKRSNRLRISRIAMIDHMKKKYGFRDVSTGLQNLYEMIDSTIFEGTWSIPDHMELDDALFFIGDQEYTQLDFARFLERNQAEFQMMKRTLLTRKMTDFLEVSLMEYEKQQVPQRYPEYKYRLKEFRDGLLLYYLTDQVLGSKVMKDTVRLRSFFNENLKDYRWDKRLECIIISCEQKEMANKAIGLISEQETKDVTRASLIASLCAPRYHSECILFSEGIFEPGDNELADKMNWNDRLSEIVEQDGRFIFILKKKTIPSGQKTLDEARAEVVSDYQDHLEKAWVKELNNKYRVKVNRKLLSNIE